MDSSVQALKCAEMPTVGRLAQEIVKSIDDGATYRQMWPSVVAMARELRKQTIPCDNIVNDFCDDGSETNKTLQLLFHAISRKTLRSLVLGRLAHDLYSEESENWQNTYDSDGPGTYLIGISIHGRQGAFLNKKEIMEVVEILNQYLVGCKTWVACDLDKGVFGSQITGEEHDAIEKALLVDNEVETEARKWKPQDGLRKPVCMSGKSTDNIVALIEMLKRRARGSFDTDTYQLSSPTYIGCGGTMPTRMPCHNSDLNRLYSSSRIMRLLNSCIRRIGLEPLVHPIPIIKIWSQADIGLSESLVTVLAQSLVTLDGLNVVEPGTVTTSGDNNQSYYDRAMQDVWITRPWYWENVNQSLDYMQGKDILQETLNTIRTKFMSEEQWEKEKEEMSRLEEQLQDADRELVKIIKNFEERHRILSEHLARLEALDELCSGMYPDLSDHSSEDEVDISEFRHHRVIASEVSDSEDGDTGESGGESEDLDSESDH